MARRQLAVLAALALLIVQAGGALAAPTAGESPGSGAASAPIAKGLVAALNSETIDRFVVQFGAKADLDGAAKTKGYVKRGRAVLDSLTSTAKQSQAAGLALAKKSGAKAKTYWLTNQMVVKGDAKLAKQFAKLKGVTKVRALKTYPLVKPVETKAAILAVVGDPEWGVDKIRADRGVGRRHPRPGRRGRERRHGRRLHAPGARRPVPRQPRRRHVRPRLQLVGPDRHLRRRAVRQRGSRHAHDGHDGRRRRPRPVHAGHRRRARRATWIAAKGCEELRLLRGRAALRRPVHPRPDRPATATTPTRRSARTSSTTPGAAAPATSSTARSSTPGARPGSSRCSRPATRADACGDGGSPGDFIEVVQRRRDRRSTTRSRTSRAAARRATARSIPDVSAPRRRRRLERSRRRLRRRSAAPRWRPRTRPAPSRSCSRRTSP